MPAAHPNDADQRAVADVEPVHLVFVPGLNNSAAVWNDVIAALPHDVRGVAVDCPAEGDIDAVAASLLGQLPERFVAVGHSFGGYVALAMLELAPDRLSGLVLVNACDNADTPEQAAARLAKAAAALSGDYETMAMDRTDLLYHPDHVADSRLLAQRRAGLRDYGVQRFVAHLAACAARPDRRALLSSTQIPVLVVAADSDMVVPPAKQIDMAEQIGAQVRTVAKAGHMLPAEQPTLLADEIAHWLARTQNPFQPQSFQESR